MVFWKNKNKTRKNTHFLTIVSVLVAWLIPALLYWVTTAQSTPKDTKSITNQILIDAKAIIYQFQAEYGAVPTNLNMLRSYAISTGQTFSPYDALGQRLDYVRFDDSHFVLRSFGEDGVQNTLGKNDDQITGRMLAIPKHPYEQVFKDYIDYKAYDALMLLGSISPDKNWYAQLYVDKLSGKKQLAVRHTKKSNLYLIAKHNSIEEYYWIPGSSRIIYSATSSDRYSDSLYLWDLEKDISVDILKIARLRSENFRRLLENLDKFHISLVSISNITGKVVFLLLPDQKKPMSPQGLIGLSSIFYIDLKSLELIHDLKPNVTELVLSNTFNIAKNFWRLENKKPIGNLVQRQFIELTFDSNPMTLEKWRRFSQKFVHTPVSSYVYWQLILLYNKFWHDPNFFQHRDAIVKNVSEISEKLASDRTAPSYMRALAAYAHERYRTRQGF